MQKRKLTKFGIEVKKKLIEKQITQYELAQKVGTSRKYLTDIMYGKSLSLKSKVVKKILNELELDSSLITSNLDNEAL